MKLSFRSWIFIIIFSLAPFLSVKAVEYLVTVNPQTGSYTIVNSIPHVGWIQVQPSFSEVDQDSSRYIFCGEDSSWVWRLYTLDATNGKVLYDPVVPGVDSTARFSFGYLKFDDSARVLYGVQLIDSTNKLNLISVNQATASLTTLYSYSGLSLPITSDVTYDQNHHQYIFYAFGTDSDYLCMINTTNGVLKKIAVQVLGSYICYDNAANTLYGFDGLSLGVINTSTAAFTSTNDSLILQGPHVGFPNLNTFDEIHHRYIAVLGQPPSYDTLRIFSVDMPVGNFTYDPILRGSYGSMVDSNVIELRFDNRSGILYGLHWAPPQLLATQVWSSPSCGGACNGAASVTAQSGVPPYTYLWTPGDSTTSGMTGLCTGTYYVTVTDSTGAAGMDSVVITSGGNLDATITAAHTRLCLGNTLQLSGPVNAGTYSWTGPNGFTASTDTVFIDGIRTDDSGEYFLSVANGACAGKDSVNITVNLPPIVKIPSANYCFGDSAILNSSNGALSYAWSDHSTDSIIVVFGLDTQIVSSVTVTAVNGCQSSETVTSTFLPKMDTVVFWDAHDTLHAHYAGGVYSYQWFLNGDSIPDATDSTHVIGVSGSYSVAVTDSNACHAFSAIGEVTGIAQVGDAEPQVELYPNPACGDIFLTAPINMDGYVICNMQGKEVLRKENVKATRQAIDVQALASGMYILKVSMGQVTLTKRFAKMECPVFLQAPTLKGQ